MQDNFDERKEKIKLVRNKYLRLHKVLMDNDRANYEKEFGVVSPGKFLEMLLSDERFAWLRTISTLIVRIDEAFDLDDGVSAEMIDGFFQESKDLIDEESAEYQEFKMNLEKALPDLPEARTLKQEIAELLN